MSARFRTKEQTYLDGETKKTFKVWHPQVKFEGKWCYLPDESSCTKIMQADDETTALEMAIKVITEEG